MNKLFFLILFAVNSAVWTQSHAAPAPQSATAPSLWKKGVHPDHCSSSKEFVAVREFLQKEHQISLSELEVRRIAYEVTLGCDRASDLFKSTFEMLVKSGVDHRFSLTVALEQSRRTGEQVRVFQDSFKYLFLEDYLNLDYQTAYRTAQELSSYWTSKDSQVGSDFVETVKYCLDPKELSLSQRECLKTSLLIAKISRYFPTGSFKPFRELMTLLQKDKKFQFTREKALAVALRVLPQGPLASSNFFEAYDYALSETGLHESESGALAHALKIAEASHRNEEPPVVEQ